MKSIEIHSIHFLSRFNSSDEILMLRNNILMIPRIGCYDPWV